MSKSKEKLMFRVVKGALVPADSYVQARLKLRNYAMNDLVVVTISKCRNSGFNRLAHHIGQLVVANIEDFCDYKPHAALKRLQLEANAACYEIMANLGDGEMIYRLPESLSYENMEEGEFQEAIKKICFHIVERYWPDSTPEEIEQMAWKHAEAA